MQPRLRPAIWTITVWEPDQQFTWVTRQAGLLTVASHVLTPLPESGGCRMDLRLRYDGVLGAIVGRLAGALTDDYLGRETAGLRLRSERRDSAT